jgi:hypothetical protein
LPTRRPILVTGALLMALVQPATAQGPAISPDSARAQIRAVLRAFYLHWTNQNWEALSSYVLSPKLLERRGGPDEAQTVARDRTRSRGSSHAAAAPDSCGAIPSARVDDAAIGLDGDWAEVSVPRCGRASAGVDEFRLLYFEDRWRFIYTDLFADTPETSTALEDPNDHP